MSEWICLDFDNECSGLEKPDKGVRVKIIHLVESFPNSKTADIIGRQILRSGTSVGANYRAACRAKSRADFISKMGNVEEEADESIYWLEVLEESKIVQSARVKELQREANELASIIVSSINTAKRNKKS